MLECFVSLEEAAQATDDGTKCINTYDVKPQQHVKCSWYYETMRYSTVYIIQESNTVQFRSNTTLH